MKKGNIIIADMNEVLFENRSKEYGAYEIRTNQHNYLVRAFMITSSLLILLFLLKFHQKGLSNAASGLVTSEIVEDPLQDLRDKMLAHIEDPKPEKPEEKIIPPSKPDKPEKKPANDDPASGVDENKVDKVNPVQDKLADPNASPIENDSITGNPSDRDAIGKKDGVLGNRADSTSSGKGPGDANKGKPCVNCGGDGIEPDPYKYYEAELPKPLNMNEIKRKIRFPEALKDMGEGGKVHVRVLIDKKGNYEKHIVLQATHPLFANALKDPLQGLKCIPGKQGNHPVKVWITIPFEFNLK